ncbi:putative mRNA 3-end processing factor [Pedobacter westerhofensis]|uniref:Putative mRNA 3-end processing factor n=1 Tax=Pedobacter westerhofensis TaxID=425512 RepID=A0A521EWM7_9SPHI|nr:MBL fold metallo-hydrolase [Pedobacter westerhofensis]SMO88334.1 putative mRNA 3-end processing factor [Pedobacter westerhofensis]
MILDDFLVPTKIGLFCAYGGFYLDPKEIVKDAVISHAHADHAITGNINVYCTEATSLFMKQRYKKFAAGEFHVFAFQQPFTLNEVKISFVPAGHMLGSALVLMEYKGIRYLYTGDYKLQPDATCEPIEFVKADVLITETTFANPDTSHPDAEEEIRKLSTTQSNIMLGAYALGKSQRLIRLISDHCPEKRILVHHSILPFVKVYESLGVNMGKYEVYDRKVMKANPAGMIYLVPPLVYRSYIRAINVVRVFATGWKHLQNNNELQLYISDHVDWKDIILTIEQVQPLQVWTTHGSGVQLKEHFQNILDVKLLN